MTVVYAPKETSSTACRNLQKFLIENPKLAGLVVVISRPICSKPSLTDMPTFREQRQKLVAFFVKYAEDNPLFWAVRPVILEKNKEGRFLHVLWWDETSMVYDKNKSSPPKMRALFNNF